MSRGLRSSARRSFRKPRDADDRRYRADLTSLLSAANPIEMRAEERVAR